MAFADNTGTSIFPTEFVKQSIKAYLKKRGKHPKVLVVSDVDWIDYNLNCSLPLPASLGLEKIIYGEYLQSGEIDLAMGIKEENGV